MNKIQRQRTAAEMSLAHQLRVLHALEHILDMEGRVGGRATDEDLGRVAQAYGVTIDEIKTCRAAL